MSWSESVRIETPEQIDFDLETAGPGSRFVAQVLDWLIKWAILFVLTFVAFIFTAMLAGGNPDNWSKGVTNVFLAVMGAIGFVFFFGYDVYYESSGNGQTPGKRITGIRVVRDGGGPIDVTAASVRNLIGLADFLPGFYLLGGVVMLLNSRAQRLGDLAAGTIVIRERSDEAPDEVDEQVRYLASDEFVFRPEHLDRCQPSDLHILQSFFGRYAVMERDERRQLAENLCDIFERKTGYRHPEPIEGRAMVRSFLASLYRDLQARRQHE